MKILFIWGLLMFTGHSIAAGPLTANEITKVAFQTGGFFIYANGWPNPNNCDRAVAVVLPENDPNYDKAYSLLLMAYASGKKVSGYSDGCIEFDGKTYNRIRGYKYLLVE